MKRIAHLLGFVILAVLLAGVATAQDSLAEAARQHRKQKEGTPVAKHEVFTNDNLPHAETISSIGDTPSDAAPQGQTPGDANADQPVAKDGKDSKTPEVKLGDTAQDRQKAWEAWRDKIGTQKDTVDQLQKESDQMEKDSRLRMNTYYGNAQSRIYGGAEEQKSEDASKAQLEQKKKAIEQAKQKLDDMQEEARRAGVPSSFRE
jgi:hypothetical protein